MVIKTEMYGTENINSYTGDLISKLNMSTKQFESRLVLTELITNAHKYGNQYDSRVPIRISIKKLEDRIRIEVSDLGLCLKPSRIKKNFADNELMNESGRGLFLVNQLSDELFIQPKRVISVIKI